MALSPPWHSSSSVSEILKLIEVARNGGDYDTIFNGKKLSFKISEIKEAAEEINDAAAEAKESVDEAAKLIPPDSLPSAELGDGLNAILEKIREIVAIFRRGAAIVLDSLKRAFKGLLAVFSDLRAALMTAFEPVLSAAQLTLDLVIDLLFQLIPTAITEFIGNLTAAIMPLVNQIKPLGDMLKSVGGLVAAQYRLHKVTKAAGAIDPSISFATAARDTILQSMAKLRDAKGIGVLIASVDVAGAATGSFTGGVSSTVVSAATSVAKLCIAVNDLIDDCLQVRNGNALLTTLSAGRTTASLDLNPVQLFNAAPILACFYLERATQSSVIAKAGFNSARATFRTDGQWMTEYKRYADQLWPLRQAAMQASLASRIDLYDTAQAVEFRRLEKSRLTVFIDLADKRRREMEEEVRRLKALQEERERLEQQRQKIAASQAQDHAEEQRILRLKACVDEALATYRSQISGARGVFTIQSDESMIVLQELEARGGAAKLGKLREYEQWVKFGLGFVSSPPPRMTNARGHAGKLKVGGRLYGLLLSANKKAS